MSVYTISCEYCGQEFTDRYIAESQKSNHKMRCPQKRYLGGNLTMQFFSPNEDATSKEHD